MKTILENIQLANAYRLSGELEKARSPFEFVCNQVGFTKNLEMEMIRGWVDKASLKDSLIIDIICLEASFLRRDESLEAADVMLGQIETLFGSRTCQQHFSFCFQKGLQHLARSHHVRSLALFNKAKKLARTPQERFAAILNSLICQESLNLLDSLQLKEFEKELAAFKDQSWAAEISDQFDAMQVRTALRMGDIDFLTTRLQLGFRNDQSSYHLAFIASLPYMNLALPSDLLMALSRRANETPGGYLALFRFTTVMGAAYDFNESPESLRTAELIDRLYLWIWRWLHNPGSVQMREIAEIIQKLQILIGGELTTEGSFMLANSIRWLGLFSCEGEALGQDLLKFTRPTQVCGSLLEFESLILDMLELRSRNEFSEADLFFSEKLKTHPQFANTKTSLAEISNFLANPSIKFASLCEALLTLTAQPLTSRKEVQVDVQMGTIRFLDDVDKRIHLYSHQVSRLIYLTLKGEAIPVTKLLSFCFDLPRYRPELQDSKISSLLNRCHKMFEGKLKLIRRGNLIYAQWRENLIIRILGASKYHEDVMSTFDVMPRTIAEATESQPSSREPASLRSVMSRQDLQSVLAIPRSTMTRHLHEWEEKGFCSRQGQGKATRYQLSPKLIQQLIGEMQI